MVIARHERYSTGHSDLIFIEENARVGGVVVRLGVGGAVEGHAFRDGAVAANALVVMLAGGEPHTTTTDENGFYRMDDVAAGVHMIMLVQTTLESIGNFSGGGERVEIIDGQTTLYNIGDVVGTRITGSVSPPPEGVGVALGGMDLPAGVVLLRPIGFGMADLNMSLTIPDLLATPFAPIDAQGRFTLENVTPGNWELDFVFLEGFQPRVAHREVIQVSGEEEELALGEIQVQ